MDFSTGLAQLLPLLDDVQVQLLVSAAPVITNERIVDLKSCSYVPTTVDDRIKDVLVTVGFKCLIGMPEEGSLLLPTPALKIVQTKSKFLGTSSTTL
ncbi:hypothetical protein NC651_029993 [Populus alba x Populus x berolinensis]|nr:hypothetical protein NC651_029990 [Populus alba x Populus x berolinensis]KAJ6877126.1 hypothetical protein NC651_029993 [Populus alba x Populus x berolinensis]